MAGPSQKSVVAAWIVACDLVKNACNCKYLSQPLLGVSEGHGVRRSGCTALNIAIPAPHTIRKIGPIQSDVRYLSEYWSKVKIEIFTDRVGNVVA